MPHWSRVTAYPWAYDYVHSVTFTDDLGYFVYGEPPHGDHYSSYLRIADFSTPGAPVELSSFNYVGRGDHCAIAGDFAFAPGADFYMLYGDNVFFYMHSIWIGDPCSPQLVSSTWGPDGYVTSLVRYGSYLLCTTVPWDVGWNGPYGQHAIYVFNITNPISPALVGQVALPPHPCDLVWYGNYAYVATEVGLSVIDLSNPETPAVTDSIPIAGGLQGVALEGELIVASSTSSTTVYCFDISSGDSPALLSEVDAGLSGRIYFSDEVAYICSGEALSRIDYFNPNAPVYRGQLPTGGPVIKIASEGDGLRAYREYDCCVLSVSNWAFAQPLGGLELGTIVRGMAFVSPFAILADGLVGVDVVDLSYPESPAHVGRTNTPGTALAVSRQGSHVFLADGMGGLRSYQLDGEGQLSFLDYLPTSNVAADIAIQGCYAFVVQLNDGILVADISDPADMWQAATLLGATDSTSVCTRGSLLFAADDRLRAWDITDPVNAVLLSDSPAPDQCSDLAAMDSWLFALAGNALHVFDVGDLGEITLTSQLRLPCTGASMALADGVLFVASPSCGVILVDVTEPSSPVLHGSIPFTSALGLP